MLSVRNLSKSFKSQQLFDGVSFSMIAGERLGLIGRNGSGKSTLFRMITGEDHPDDGEIAMPRGYTVGHLEQTLRFSEDTILKEACLGLPADERDQEYRAEIILSGLGFSEADMQRPPSAFSGGFQIRINLAKVLLSSPHLLLLDEPTNYLDIVSARWLARFLKEWPNELIIITHDRDFMDDVTTHTMIIRRRGIRRIQGASSKLLEQLTEEDVVYEKTRLNENKRREEVEEFINRFRAKASKATQVQSKIKALEKMGVKEELVEEQTLDFRFSQAPFNTKVMLEVKDLTFGYDKNIEPLIKDLIFNLARGERIGVIGKNGRGKSTLLRLLAGELEPTSGTMRVHANVRLGYFGQTNISRLNPALSIEEEVYNSNTFLHRTVVRSICGTMMFPGDDALKKIKVLSGGEKSRVLLAKILATPTNLLLLDEPTNHLDIESVEALIKSVAEYEGGIIIVTHNEHILRALCSKLVVFQSNGVQFVQGDYEYFLDKIGWEEEAGLAGMSRSKKRNAAAPSPQNDQKPVGAFTLKQMEKDIAKIEKDICGLEDKLKATEEEIAKASQSSDGKKIAELGRTISALTKEIEAGFEKLSDVTKEYDRAKDK